MRRYFKIDSNDLPSRGRFYHDAKIELTPLTFGQAKFLCSKNDFNSKALCDILVAENLKGLDPDELLLGDYNYILMWLRVNSFLGDSDFAAKVHCPNCNSEAEWKILSQDIDFKYLETSAYSRKIGGKRVSFHPAKASHVSKYEDDNLKLVDDCSDAESVFGNLEELEYDLFEELFRRATEFDIGIDPSISCICPRCGLRQEIRVLLDHRNILGALNIKTLLKSQLQISKYTHFRIDDDFQLNEYILANQIVKEMADEESKQYKDMNRQSSTNNFSMSQFAKQFKV